jgi:hypothetical protein
MRTLVCHPGRPGKKAINGCSAFSTLKSFLNKNPPMKVGGFL